MANKEKTALVTVDMSRFYWSLESASVKVTSPTGKSVWIDKSNTRLFTDEEQKVWQRLAKHHQKQEVQLWMTYGEMELLKAMSEIPRFRPPSWRIKIKHDRIAKMFEEAGK